MLPPKVHPSHRGKSCQHNTCPLTALCTHLTRNKVDNTILTKPVLRQKSHCEPHFSTHWWDRLTLQHTGGEVWVWQHTTIISSCHYLPSHSQLCSQRQMRKHCKEANMHKRTQKHKHRRKAHKNTQDSVKAGASTLLLVVTHCQVAGWVLSIELTEISILATTNSGSVSLSIWVEQHEGVQQAEGFPLSLTNVCICLHLLRLSWHWNGVKVSIHERLYHWHTMSAELRPLMRWVII